jgi:hypothetical protein
MLFGGYGCSDHSLSPLFTTKFPPTLLDQKQNTLEGKNGRKA